MLLHLLHLVEPMESATFL